MDINADFSQRVVMHGGAMPWVDSPIAGVQRRMLDRIGEEVARATSLVRYAPHSQFAPHTHGGGEEFLVLEGVFQDERGDFPAGSYVRNPPGTRHTPRSTPGCVIFVKLWQCEPDDRTSLITNIDKMGRIADKTRTGVAVTPLFQDAQETVQVEEWQPGIEIEQTFDRGMELLVLDGELNDNGDRLCRLSWLRLPCGGTLSAQAGNEGAKIWVKSRHLHAIRTPKAP